MRICLKNAWVLFENTSGGGTRRLTPRKPHLEVFQLKPGINFKFHSGFGHLDSFKSVDASQKWPTMSEGFYCQNTYSTYMGISSQQRKSPVLLLLHLKKYN